MHTNYLTGITEKDVKKAVEILIGKFMKNDNIIEIAKKWLKQAKNALKRPIKESGWRSGEGENIKI